MKGILLLGFVYDNTIFLVEYDTMLLGGYLADGEDREADFSVLESCLFHVAIGCLKVDVKPSSVLNLAAVGACVFQAASLPF